MALVHKKVEDFKERVKEQAEKLVTEVFPQKALELDKLLNTSEFIQTDLTKIHFEINIPIPEPIYENDEIALKKRKITMLNGTIDVEKIDGTRVLHFPNGIFPSNENIIRLFDILKPYIREMIEDTNLVKMWILFMIPRIEDGNNFGVSIQEETLAEVRQVETESATYLEQISRYYLSRGKLVSKIAKYPHIEDYRKSIFELDEKQYLTMKLICAELRNNYSSLHDLILKNIEKIKKPKTNNMDHLY